MAKRAKAPEGCSICGKDYCRPEKHCRRPTVRHRPDGSKKYDGPPCELRVKVAGHACKLHGGNSLRGREHPRYSTGEYSEYEVAEETRAIARKFAEDPDAVSLMREIVVMRALMQEIFHEREAGISAPWIRRLQRLAQMVSEAKSNAARLLLSSKMIAEIKRGARLSESRSELRLQAESVRKIVETQLKRLGAGEDMVPKATVLALLDLVATSVRQIMKMHGEAILALVMSGESSEEMAGKIEKLRVKAMSDLSEQLWPRDDQVN